MTPSQRGLVLVDRSALHKGKPVKKLTQGLSKKGGRNNTGRITARRRGGGHKRAYRLVDFKRRKWDVPATVERLEYDPNRSAFIALVKYEDGELAYILAPQRLAPGDTVVAGERVDVKPGNAMPLMSMPIGTIIHNVEMKQGKGGQLARAAGTYAQLIGRDRGYALIRLSSGEQRMVRAECMATIGAVSNSDNSNQKLGKAGRNRWRGRRPKVRGPRRVLMPHWVTMSRASWVTLPMSSCAPVVISPKTSSSSTSRCRSSHPGRGSPTSGCGGSRARFRSSPRRRSSSRAGGPRSVSAGSGRRRCAST